MSLPDSRDEETLFVQALELPEAERAAFLEQACGADSALRTSVEALIRAHQAATSFLPSVTDVARPATGAAASVEEQPGDSIGRYKLLQKIGEGGCGIVYMAEQEEPVRRRVALKVIKLGMDTKAVIARFEAERQALAMMDHPNIAKVLDGGSTDSGRPYFVMELVRGIPVTKYCDENGLGTEKRLELFNQVCHAIQHAHQKGIIHRDIKPSNILVTLHDGLPVPKVIDFGIAKATQGRLTDQTYFTAFEQFLGTPAYMSPEQAEMSGLDIDTRSDIYSLGVLLYELLTGRQPFDPKTFLSAGIDEMRRLIREVDPPKPSTRLSTLTEADRTTVAKLRGTAPAQLSLVLAGDLDWIVMRCLEKDRTRRYATPSELVADIQRHLRNEPVIARPPSTGYLLRKLIRRHRIGFAAWTAVAVSLIAGLVVSSILLVREHAARERAVTAEAKESHLRQEADANATQARIAAAKSTQVAQFMTDMLKGVGPSVALGRDTKLLRDILDATVNRLDTELRDQPAVAADLRNTLGAVYLDLGQAAAAEPLLRAALATHRALAGNQSAEVASSLNLLGRALGRLNKMAEAETMLKEALAIRRRLFGSEHPLVADTLAELAWLVDSPRSHADTQVMLQEVLAIRRLTVGPEHPLVAAALYDLGRVSQLQVGHEMARSYLSEALAIQRRMLVHADPALAATLDALGVSYAHELDKQNDSAALHREALGIRRQVLGDQHPLTLVSLLNFSGRNAADDIPPETVDLVRDFVASQRKSPPRDPVLLAPALLALASLENLPGRNPEEAQVLNREARLILAQARARGATLDLQIIQAMMLFAWTKFMAHAPAEGLAMGEESLEMARAASGPNGGQTLIPAHAVAWSYLALGRRDEAMALLETIVPLLRARFGEDFPQTLVDTATLCSCYCATNRVANAHQLLTTSLQSLEKSRLPRPRSYIGIVQGEFGLTLLREGRFAEAEAMLRKSLDEYDANTENLPLSRTLRPRSRVASGLGQALAGRGKYGEAEPLLVGAYEDMQTHERYLACNPTGTIRDALNAVVALYTAWGKPEKVAEWKSKPAATAATP
jgi:serine/threonine protein kinase/tetratricopeptide (TPR) repeat protein